MHYGNIGNHFYDLGKWASFPVQLMGYLPLSGNASGNITKIFGFTWASIWPYVSILLTAASLSWCFGYFWRYKDFKDFIQFKTPTETGAFNLMIIITNFSGIYTKLFGIVNGRKYERFWGNTRSLLACFQTNGGVRDHEPPEEFKAIQSSCKFAVLLMLVPVIIHVSYFYVWTLVNSIADDNSELESVLNADTQVYLGLAFGYLIAFLHVSNGIWMNFFVKIYSQCLLSISEELKLLGNAMNISKNDENKEGGVILPQNLKVSRENYFGDNRFLSLQLKNILDKLACVDEELSRFNDFFGMLLLLQISNCVINLLVFSFFACLWMGRGQWKDGFLETVVPLYLYGKELFDMATVAETLSSAADDVLIALAQDVMLGNLSEEIYLRIQIITVQLCTKPPIISARQFFTINRGLVTSVMSALATFLVVLVQFRDQDDEDAKHIVAQPTVGNVSMTIANRTVA